MFSEFCGLLFIVMRIENIADKMNSSARINARSCFVNCFCYGINISARIAVRFIPCLIERAPAYDSRVVEVTFKLFDPFVFDILHLSVIVVYNAPRIVFPPYEIPLFITVVKEKRLEYFLMKSRAVESACFGTENIVMKLVGVSCGINTVGVKSLVEYGSLKNGFSVQHELLTVKPDVAQSEI